MKHDRYGADVNYKLEPGVMRERRAKPMGKTLNKLNK